MMQEETRLTLVSLSELENNILNPIVNKLNSLETLISKKKNKTNSKKLYRNKDLKELFGFSSNTIIKYRDTGVLPYTTIGEVYFYPIDKINDLLTKNLSL